MVDMAMLNHSGSVILRPIEQDHLTALIGSAQNRPADRTGCSDVEYFAMSLLLDQAAHMPAITGRVTGQAEGERVG